MSEINCLLSPKAALASHSSAFGHMVLYLLVCQLCYLLDSSRAKQLANSTKN